MKTNFFKLIIGLVITASAAQAFAGSCYVLLNTYRPCLRARLPQARMFQDSDRLAQINPLRCQQRAAEYHAYCGYSPNESVYSYYHNGKSWVTASGNNTGLNINYIYSANDLQHWIYLGQQK